MWDVIVNDLLAVGVLWVSVGSESGCCLPDVTGCLLDMTGCWLGQIWPLPS